MRTERHGGLLQTVLVAAAVAVLCPVMMHAQARNDTSTKQATSPADTTRRNTTSTSTGDIAPPAAPVPPEAIKEQSDPNLIGSPAWWANHSTADGKPLSARSSTSKKP